MAAISGKGSTFEQDILKLIFNATAIANIADNAATSPLTNLFVALHTADPLEAGDQTSSEATYTGYARVAVLRTSGGWTVSAAGDPTTSAECWYHYLWCLYRWFKYYYSCFRRCGYIWS
jgi:hypothetical protein